MRQAGKWIMGLAVGLLALGHGCRPAQAAQTAGHSADILSSPATVQTPAKQPVGPEAGVTDKMLKAGTSIPRKLANVWRRLHQSPL